MTKTEIIRYPINNTRLNVNAFSQKANTPYSTLRSMLDRGVEYASVNNVVKVCKALEITVEDLYQMASDIGQDVGHIIREERERQNISQKKLADALELSEEN